MWWDLQGLFFLFLPCLLGGQDNSALLSPTPSESALCVISTFMYQAFPSLCIRLTETFV